MSSQTRRTSPIWAFNALLALLAVLLGVLIDRANWAPLLQSPAGFSPWMLVPIAFLCEHAQISVKFRADAQTFSFGEITLVLGLAYAGPLELVVASCVGFAISLVVRKQLPVRTAFNLGAQAVTVCVAAILAHTFGAGSRDPASLRVWLGLFLGVAITAPVQSSLVAIVRSIAERRLLLSDAPRMILYTEINSLTVAALGVLVVVAVGVAPVLGLFAIVPLLFMYTVSAQYLAENARRRNVEFLYDTAQTIHRTPDTEQAIINLLDRARTSFRSEFAAVLIRRVDAESWLTFTVGTTSGRSEFPDTAPAWQPTGTEAVIVDRMRNPLPGSVELLDQFGASNALVTTLRTDTDVIGLLIAAERIDGIVGFGTEDRRLFEILAAQLSIGLENSQLERSLGALTRMEEELRHQATHDALTGLANRVLFAQTVERSGANDRAVLLIDLDDFKVINDSLGHAAGDEVLCHVARQLRAAVRENDLVARLGGDEFAIYLASRATREAAAETAERIAIAISRPTTIAGRQVEIRSSIGIATAPPGMPLEEILRNADVAMYEAKHHGKGRHMMFESGMDDAARERLQIITGLRSATSGEQLHMLYQPIVDLNDGHPVAVEALLRWEHPELGSLGPDRFIPLAEESGSIVQLGLWAIERACRDVAHTVSCGQPIELHVNISPQQIASDEFVDAVKDILDRCAFSPSRLMLEITEKTALADSSTLAANVQNLRTLGVGLALDDFGTGYSSLAAAHGFPLDLIKIDQLFVRTMRGPDDATLVKAIVAMAESLGLSSVAEGIETEEQWAILRQFGCPYGQGYLFAAPMPIAALEQRWAEKAQADAHDERENEPAGRAF